MVNVQTSALADGAGSPPAMSREEKRKVIDGLKKRDNVTNFYFLAQDYAILIGTIALTIWSYTLVESAVHAGTHHILFKNRVLNETVSDWLAAFPIFTSTYRFRLHHLAHHQFVNDPTRDPNFELSRDGGHWLDFPVEHIEILVGIARMLWFPNLARYVFARARQSSIGGDNNPYTVRVRSGSPWPVRVGVLFIGLMPLVMFGAQLMAGYLASIALLGVVTAGCVIYYLVIPDSAFQESRLDPVVSHRVTSISWLVYMAIVYGSLSLIQFSTGHPAWMYFLVLWVVPIFTTFPMFMVLREWLQHGNADRGRYTNSRVMLFNPFMRYAVMPWGMDYHLPHHIVASVPHYNIRKLHDFLLRTDAQYAQQVQVVEGWSSNKDANHPSIVEVLGPEPVQSGHGEIHVPSDTLEYASVNDPKGIAEEERASRGGRVGPDAASS